jgi:aryl-alcohol dehydrogenase-like predicted oxidoreductase
MNLVRLGRSDLMVTPVCLGTMTFGEQVGEEDAFAILDRSLERGVNFIDTAEMYSVPTRAKTYGATETIIGNWFARRPGARQRLVLASKVAGPSRGMDWVRGGRAEMLAQDIIDSCEASLRRLQTDVIDLYQIHWPARNTPAFGNPYYDPAKERPAPSVQEQLQAFDQLCKRGLVRAIGLSNETPWGVAEFVRVAEQHGLPRIATVQNGYNLINRAPENGLDEVMHRSEVSLLAYSPLAFGQLSGKYDASGFTSPQAPAGRLSQFESVRQGRWGRAQCLVAARRYNELAREHGLSPARMALAFCYSKWQVASTIIGVTSLAQLDEDLDAWGTQLEPALLAQIDALRREFWDPAN